MVDEIDSRYYAHIVSGYWRQILAFAAVAAALAALASSPRPPTSYEAVATLNLNKAALVTHNGSEDPQLTLQKQTARAKTKAVRKRIISRLGDALPAELRTVTALGPLCSVSSDSAQGMIQLSVRYSDAQVATDIANTWAAVVIQQLQKRHLVPEDAPQHVVSPAQLVKQEPSQSSVNPALVGALALLAGTLASFVVGYHRQLSRSLSEG
jgi:capsular polysaccharide biosynthesis protein